MALVNFSGVGAGLAEAGKNIAATAGAYTLEAQKADAEMDKVKLIDQLTGAREEKGRAFTTSERVATQQFTGGQNDLQRANAKDIANIGANAAVQSAGIHAGATIAAAHIGADSAAAERRADREALDPMRQAQTKLYDAETLQKTITSQSAQNVLDAKKQLEDALTSNDPTKIADAKVKIYAAEFSAKDEVQRVSLYQAQAKLIEQAMSATQAKLVALQDPMKQMDPTAKALADTLSKELERQRIEYNTATRSAAEALKSLPTYSPPGGAPGSTAPDLSKYLRPASPVTGAPAPLINRTSP